MDSWQEEESIGLLGDESDCDGWMTGCNKEILKEVIKTSCETTTDLNYRSSNRHPVCFHVLKSLTVPYISFFLQQWFYSN